MDNVTHTLAGMVLAEAAVQARATKNHAGGASGFRAVAMASSIVAANLPDADLFYTGLGGDRLAYLLHHRGYTHTLVIAIPGAVLLWGAAALLWRWRRRVSPARTDTQWLFALILASTLSHLALDWTNSYGVHPLWPIDNDWMYGDFVFIVEPWFWVAAVPMLVAASASRITRTLLSIILLIGLGVAWRFDQVTTGAAVGLTLGAVLSVALARLLTPRRSLMMSVAVWIAVTLLMAAGSTVARRVTARAIASADPTAEVLDIVVTPLPANAVCMSVIAVERSGGVYRATHARVSALPSIAPASGCGASEPASPRLHASSRHSSSEVVWGAEWSAPHAEIATLARESCSVLAALRFIRVPAWRLVDDSSVMIGDLRYGDMSGRGFSDIALPRRSLKCPGNVPPWTPPRVELLDR